MADGTTTPISQVQAGDEILAFDATTGHNVPGQVVETFTHEDVAVLEVQTSAGRVETTATHPFYVEGKGYTPAQDLRAGDLLRTPTGQQVVVEQLSYTGQRATVHNLHVKGYNNYHVHTNTGTPILVHNNGTNKCGDALAYRVIRSDENPAAGLVAKNPEATYSPTAHVRSGSRLETQYISATRSIDVAERHAAESGNRIVQIDLSKVDSEVLDLSTDAGRQTHLTNRIARAYAAKSEEVLIVASVPPGAITLRGGGQ